MDTALLERPGNKDIQLDLFLDYASNVKLYPAFQDYFRKAKPPLLAIWGKNDPFFIPAGAEAFRKDIPNAQVEFLDTGHFAIETHVVEIAAAMKEFLTANGGGRYNEFLCCRTPRSCWSTARGLTVRAGTTSFCRCEKKVFKVTCAPIPLTSLTEDIAALERVLRENERAARCWRDTRMRAL